MTDIGREILDRRDPIVERGRHFPERDGQVADLVLARGEIRDLLALLGTAAPHADCRRCEPSKRVGDGRGEKQRQDDVDEGSHAEDADDGEALGLDDLVDVAGLRRKQENAEHGAEPLDGNGH
ncbi:hypothetical protein D9M70_580490 [compost metagenome]